jgi:GNAT superfamily N-acetyltransferase
MIQVAQSYHLKDLVKIGRSYWAESPYHATHEFDEDTLLESLRRAMIVATHNVIVAEADGQTVGGSVAYIGDYPWCTSVRSDVELLYVLPEYRDRGFAEQMLEHQTEWSRKMGAVEILAGDIGFRPPVVERWLDGQGYQDSGVVMRKLLV